MTGAKAELLWVEKLVFGQKVDYAGVDYALQNFAERTQE